MQRLACLALVITAACGGGTATGEATLSGLPASVKASAAETFSGPDAAGNNVLGWNILFYENEPGGDCLEGTVAAKIGIYTSQAEGSAPNAILQQGGISIVTTNPPMAPAGQAVANMGVEGVSDVMGIIQITDFRLAADAKTAVSITGTVTAGGYDANSEGVTLNGTFTAPVCEEE
jgi:hypothetical protein